MTVVLAIVVPETWLTRDYAEIVRYALFKFFRIHYIIEDRSANWFSGAQVKTNLVIAERQPSTAAIIRQSYDGFLKVSISKECESHESLVGNIFPESSQADYEFSDLLSEHLKSKSSQSQKTWEHEWINVNEEVSEFYDGCKRHTWLSRLEPNSIKPSKTDHSSRKSLPQKLRTSLAPFQVSHDLQYFGEIGVNIGQGLRTGANKFFYVDSCKASKTESIVSPNKGIQEESISVPSNLIGTVIRRQSELGSNLSLDPARLSGRVLLLEGYALPEDRDKYLEENHLEEVDLPVKRLPSDLCKYLRKAAAFSEQTKSGQSRKSIPELSAVKTNINLKPSSGTHKPRWWYWLPKLVTRHTPDLLIARVNSHTPKTYWNPNRSIIVDANFSTIWLDDESAVTKYAAFAILNSSWCRVQMECIGTVMGGGALKLEAAHLRKLLIPRFSISEMDSLDKLGRRLAKDQSETAFKEVDLAIAKIVCPTDGHQSLESTLSELRMKLVTDRSRK